MSYPALAVAMTRSLGIALSTEDAQRLHRRLQDIASQLVLQEREECAKLCETVGIPIDIEIWLASTKREITKHTAVGLAKAIRARGEI